MHNKTHQLILAGVFIALGLVLPMAFHMIGGAGPIFLPMHIPVLIGGFFLSPMSALSVGVITPLLSGLFNRHAAAVSHDAYNDAGTRCVRPDH